MRSLHLWVLPMRSSSSTPAALTVRAKSHGNRARGFSAAHGRISATRRTLLPPPRHTIGCFHWTRTKYSALSCGHRSKNGSKNNLNVQAINLLEKQITWVDGYGTTGGIRIITFVTTI